MNSGTKTQSCCSGHHQVSGRFTTEGLIVGLPVIATAIHASMSHLLSRKEDQHYATTVIGFLTTLHILVVSAYRSMRLPEKICDAEKVLKVTDMALSRLEFAQHKPAEAIKDILGEVEEKVAQMKMISDHQPPNWAYKLFDELLAAGKLPKDLSIKPPEENDDDRSEAVGKKV